MIFRIRLLTFVLATGISISRAQSIQDFNIDSLSRSICHLVIAEPGETDSATVINSTIKVLKSYYNTIPSDTFTLLLFKCIFLTVRNCSEFARIVIRLEKEISNEGWQFVDKEPISDITVAECDTLFKMKKLFYWGSEKRKTFVTLTATNWFETFPKNTYSSLSVHRINAFEFELTFLNSDDLLKSGISNAGDKYEYKILEKNKDHYLLYTHIPDTEFRWVFKMYYK